MAVKTYDHRAAKDKAIHEHMQNEERLAGKLEHAGIIVAAAAFSPAPALLPF